MRNDIGILWENFLISERYKNRLFTNSSSKMYYWRTYTGAELDYVEEENGILNGFEFKWKEKRVRPPESWTNTYNADFSLITPSNWLTFTTERD